MGETYDIYDENNNPTGIESNYQEIHSKGLWHRTVHLWVFNDKKILLSKRSMSISFPGKWDMSSGGHVTAGEDEFTSITREALEEIGLELKRDELRLGFTHRSKTGYDNFKNNEHSYVFFHRTEKDLEQFRPDNKETTDIIFMDIGEFIEKMRERTFRDNFIPIGETYLKKVLEQIEKMSLK